MEQTCDTLFSDAKQWQQQLNYQYPAAEELSKEPNDFFQMSF